MDNNFFAIILRSSYSSGSTGLYIFLVIIAIGVRVLRIFMRNSAGSGSGPHSSGFNPDKLKKTVSSTSHSCPHCGEHLPAKATSCPACYKYIQPSGKDSLSSQPHTQRQTKSYPDKTPAPPEETLYPSPEVKAHKKPRTCPNCGMPVKRWAKNCNSCYENL